MSEIIHLILICRYVQIIRPNHPQALCSYVRIIQPNHPRVLCSYVQIIRPNHPQVLCSYVQIIRPNRPQVLCSYVQIIRQKEGKLVGSCRRKSKSTDSLRLKKFSLLRRKHLQMPFLSPCPTSVALERINCSHYLWHGRTHSRLSKTKVSETTPSGFLLW